MKETITRTTWLVWLILAGGCAASDNTVGGNGATSATPPPAGANAGATCPTNNLTQACACPYDNNTVAGRQVCDVSSGWGACQCARVVGGGVQPTDGATPNGTVTFNWVETMPQATCKAGHYLGIFDGAYLTPAFGIAFSPIGIPISGNVDFDLYQVGSGELFQIRNGAMVGCALGVAPFLGDIVGSLDCSVDPPLVKVGLTNGHYNVTIFSYYFDGKAVGNYDKGKTAFYNGIWAVSEPENILDITLADGTVDIDKAVWGPLPEIAPGTTAPILGLWQVGGGGTWSADRTGPATGVQVDPSLFLKACDADAGTPVVDGGTS